MPSTLGRAVRAFVPPALVFALLGIALLSLGVPPVYTLVAVAALALLLAAGVGHTPHSRFAVGRRGRVTDREVVRHVACDDCGGDAVWGTRREYRREFVLFGTPVWTLGAGENVYCRACTGDPVGHGTDRPRASAVGAERDSEREAESR